MAMQRPPESTGQFETESTATSDTVLVGIPAYNEEVGIGSVVLAAKEYADEVIVIDDGSADKTVDIATQAGATVVEHSENSGKGRAVQTLLQEVESRDFGALVLLDGDGQHVPADIPDVTEPVLEGDCDIAIGSRYLAGKQTETPFHRRFGQRVLDIMTTGSARTKVTDSQSGFRALSPAAAQDLRIRTDGMGVESEMINDATQKGLSIQEIPIDVRYDGIDGQTHNPFRHGLGVLMFILQLVRDRHPLLFFGIPGSVLTLFGALYGLDAILVYQTSGTFYPAKVLVAGFSTIIGVLGVFCGLILNQIATMVANLEGVVR
ncbi:glycosyltransferase family 2 protein [Halorarum halophilum]|uniref:Glycosyltransferase family 2 protein n=1 Tax=Halorarum halophilum TaxID=2743090 RepID=A0A7D5GKD9_9EURY|nr:glycosyltransferase family 2 protein [Halobaculum halophilum]QLG27404.1 glycosyltransferase family 2 protein [Halobaculum halophilum]